MLENNLYLKYGLIEDFRKEIKEEGRKEERKAGKQAGSQASPKKNEIKYWNY